MYESKFVNGRGRKTGGVNILKVFPGFLTGKVCIGISCIYTLEKHFTQIVQSSLHAGCSRRVHRIVYLAVKKGNRLLVSLINPAVYLLNKIYLG